MSGKRGQQWSEQAQIRKTMRLQHQHDMQLAIVNAMAKDPELKYFLGVAGGSAVGILGAVAGKYGFSTSDKDETERAAPEVPETPTQWKPSETFGPFYWLIPGAYGIEKGAEINDKVLAAMSFENLQGSPGGGNLFGFVPNLLTIAGTGFAGFCATVLILKAIFGDEDVASLMSGVGSIVPL